MMPESEVAQGVHDHPKFKLGKAAKKVNAKTVSMNDFVSREIQVPLKWDLDTNRAPFKSHLWGNDQFGDCVVAARANHLLRLERIETRRTPGLTDTMAIDTYKAMTGCVSPGDSNDTGLVMLDALAAWRAGWELKFGSSTKKYSIDAFGQISTNDHWLLKAATYLFNGIEFGFNLPASAQSQTRQGFWDVTTGPGSEPGSWGGHAVTCKRFDDQGMYVLSWGREIRVTTAFIDAYADEAWTVIDSLDNWRATHGVLDVAKLLDYFNQVGIKQHQ